MGGAPEGEDGVQHGEGELARPGSSERQRGEAFLAKSPGPHCVLGGVLLRAALHTEIHAGHSEKTPIRARAWP